MKAMRILRNACFKIILIIAITFNIVNFSLWNRQIFALGLKSQNFSEDVLVQVNVQSI